MIASLWIRPADALERHRAGEFDLILPTMRSLETLDRFASADDVLRRRGGHPIGSRRSCLASSKTTAATASCCPATPATTRSCPIDLPHGVPINKLIPTPSAEVG